MSEDTDHPGPWSAAGTPETAPPAEPSVATPPTDVQTPPSAPPPPAGFGALAGPGEPARAPFLPPVAPSSYPPPPAWSSPGGYDTQPTPPATPAVIPFSYPPPPDPTLTGAPELSSGSTDGRSGRFRAWLPVALVAALIGGVVGAAVTAITDHNSNSGTPGVTIHESNASPGAAVLSGNVTIPQLVDKVIPAVVSIDVKSGGSEDEGGDLVTQCAAMEDCLGHSELVHEQVGTHQIRAGAKADDSEVKSALDRVKSPATGVNRLSLSAPDSETEEAEPVQDGEIASGGIRVAREPYEGALEP